MADASSSGRSARALALLLLLGALGGGGWILSERASAAQRPGKNRAEAAVSVQTALVRKGDAVISLSALGTVTPLASVTLKTRIAGTIMEVGYQEGQDVKKGDFLVQIDPRPYQNALQQAEGQLVKDQALLKMAELTLSRYQILLKQNSIAKQQVDTEESLVQQYKGAVQSDEGEVASAELNLSYCRITSPLNGRAGLRLVDPGNYVQASDTTGLVSLTQMKPISVLFTIPEDRVPELIKRRRAPGEILVEAFDRARKTKLAVGSLSAVNNEIDSSTGTLKLRATFDNAEEGLFPNQFVNVRLVLSTLKDQLLLPSAAIQNGAPGTFVYLVKDDGRAHVQPIKIGPEDGANTVVTEGLSAGDRVVLDGIDKLHDGAKVVTAKEEAQASN